MRRPATNRVRAWCRVIAATAAIVLAPHSSPTRGEAFADAEIHPPFTLSGSLISANAAPSPNAGFERQSVWKVDPAQKTHPLVRGLPKSFAVRKAGFSLLVAETGATVVCADPNGVPCITFKAAGLGTVVHLNHGTHEVGPEVPIAKPVMRAFVNAVEFLVP